jgi:hypothetical protein
MRMGLECAVGMHVLHHDAYVPMMERTHPHPAWARSGISVLLLCTLKVCKCLGRYKSTCGRAENYGPHPLMHVAVITRSHQLVSQASVSCVVACLCSCEDCHQLSCMRLTQAPHLRMRADILFLRTSE